MPARAEEPRFLEPHVRAGVFVATTLYLQQLIALPMPSAAVIFHQLIVADVSGFFLPTPNGPVGFGALQAGPMLRLGARGAGGAGLTVDLRALLGAGLGTQNTSSSPQTFLVPAGLGGVAVEGTNWFGRSWGLSGELVANVLIAPETDPLLVARISVGVAF
ncbi:MAG TPA: hypothetical protein VFA20_34635 [Myxococcaceae bacterium]|nr:hypothetical protein [Myxococcaceae bacterium]